MCGNPCKDLFMEMNSCSVHALQVPRLQLFTLLVLDLLAHGKIIKILV